MTPELLPCRSAPAWARALRAWYRRHRRAMPWRGTRDPYRVWVSEIMLQQTQVATATPFYQRFLERFPTLESLATASEPAVLSAWSGLGYYRRARHLRDAARIVVRDHGGRVPEDPRDFGALPGVGRYTTGAVLSICFDRPLAVLDGNVARVLSRVAALPANVKTSRGARALWAIADALVPMRDPGDWNQALMELGAVVCTARAPRCEVCPLRSHCRARSLGRVEDYPPPVPRRARVALRRAVAWIVRDGRVLVTPRRGTLLEGLWEPPGVDLEPGVTARAALGRELRRLGVQARLAPAEIHLRHTITHRDIEVRLWSGEGDAKRSSSLKWIDPERPSVAVTALTRKALEGVRRRRT